MGEFILSTKAEFVPTNNKFIAGAKASAIFRCSVGSIGNDIIS